MSKGTSTLFVVADTDWLFDDYSVRKFNFFGQTAAELDADTKNRVSHRGQAMQQLIARLPAL